MSTLACLLCCALTAPGFVVAPGGDDAGPGSAAAPFATVARAKAAVAQRVAAGLTADVTVELRAGTYELAEPLTFTAADGGDGTHSVVWSGVGDVTLSGGRTIGGWTRGDGPLWTAKVAPGTFFRQLAVNGKLAERTSYPRGTHWLRVQSAALAADRSSYTLKLPPGDLKPWANVEDLEVVVLGNWELTRKRVKSVDPATGLVTLAPPHAGSHDAIRPGPGRPLRFENARELLDGPGQCYLDRSTGVVTYWPREGEDLTTARVVAPRLTRLLTLAGTPERPVRHLRFQGLRLADVDWAMPEYGFNGVQASWHTYPAPGQHGWDWTAWRATEPAMLWTWTEGCSFTDGALERLGGVGVRLGAGCHDAVFEGNLVRDIGFTGIMAGADNWSEKDPPGELARNIRIANNHVTRCGLLDYGAVGIWGSFLDGATIAHNEVHALPYSGISLGWRWNNTPTGAKNNRIECNHSYDTMNMLCDGGCLYTLGRQPGSSIVGNWFHDAHRSQFAQGAPNNGIFFDEGTTGFHVAGNLIHSNSSGPIRFNQTGKQAQTWGENWFDVPARAPGRVGQALVCDGSGGAFEVPHAPALDAPALSAEAWVKLDGAPTGVDNRRWIVNKNGNEWQEGHWGLVVNASSVGAYLNIGGGQGNMVELWAPEGTLKPGEWHHLGCSYDGHDLRVYRDGAQVATKAVNKPRKPGRTPLVIGQRQDGYITFKGLIDEVRVYPRALTADEFGQRYRGAAVEGASGSWSFEEATGEAAGIAQVRATAGLEPAYRERLLR